MAGGELTGSDGPQGGDLGAATLVFLGVRTARVEWAAGRRVRGGRYVALQDDALLLGAGIGHRYGGKQRAGVGVAWRAVELRGRGEFHDLAEVHHGDLLSDVLH